MRGSHRDHQDADVAAVDQLEFGEPLVQNTHEARVLTEGIGLPHRNFGFVDHRRDVDACVIGAGEQQRRDYGRTVEIGEHLAKVRFAAFTERHPDLKPRP
jgi:hypothetical protein